MTPPSGASGSGGRAARQAARRERRLRSEQRYQQLEQARRERRAKTREAIREAARLPRVPSGRALAMLGGGVALLVLLTLWLSSRGDSRPLVTRSCTTPAFALGRPSTGDGLNVAWAATGPQAGAYTVVVDGRTVASPRLANCTADGTLPPLTAGVHRVELRRNGEPVARATLNP